MSMEETDGDRERNENRQESGGIRGIEGDEPLMNRRIDTHRFGDHDRLPAITRYR